MEQKKEISIIDLFIELKNRIKMIIVISVVFSLMGITYTNLQNTSYTAKFYVYLNHPAIVGGIAHTTFGVEKWLKDSKNNSVMPKLEWNEGLYTVTSFGRNYVDNTKERFEAYIRNHLIKIKQTAIDINSNSSNEKYIIKESVNINNQATSVDSLPKIDVDDIMKRLSFSFIVEKRLHPNNFKYSVLGFAVGLFISVLFILMKFSLRRDD